MLSPFGSFAGMFGSIDRDLAILSNSIRRDVERTLNRDFHTWNLFQSDPIFFDPRHTSYRMKMLVDDNGHVTVKTAKKDPNSEWETHVEEFDASGKSLEQGSNKQEALEQNKQQSEGMNKDKAQKSGEGMMIDEDVEKVANSIRHDVEQTLNKHFGTWSLLSHDPTFFDPRHTSYRMKMLVDDNGHVTVKTAKKDPNSPWQTEVKEYDRGQQLQQGEKHEALDQSKEQSQSQQQSQLQQQPQDLSQSG